VHVLVSTTSIGQNMNEQEDIQHMRTSPQSSLKSDIIHEENEEKSRSIHW